MFFGRGAAAERFVEPQLFARLVAAASSELDTQRSPGGNAALMANVAARLGGSPLLGGPVGAGLRPLLHSRVQTVAGDSAGDVDQVHLILEYARGEQWFGVSSPRANRFILHSDNVNGKLAGLEAFHGKLVMS